MDRPITRTFFRGEGGERRFVEITWIGHQVEVVTGKVGAAGRASERAFTSVTARDAFLEKRAAQARRDGYVEGAPGDLPVPDLPDPPDPRAARAEALRKKHASTAFVPQIAEGDDTRSTSKIGGTPWLPKGTPWPACGGCSQPLQFVLQLARDEVPEPVRWAFRDDLLQLFVCDTSGKVGNPGWLCQADGMGWMPFSTSTLVRHVHRDGDPADLHEALPLALLDLRRRCGLETMVAHCQTVGDQATGAVFAQKLDTEGVDPRDYQVPDPKAPPTMHRPFLFPARRITGYAEVVDIPAYGDLDDLELLETALGHTCQPGDKLGGYPRWAQDRAVVPCRGCGKAMRYLLQVVSNGLSPITLGGDGLGWVFVCAPCGEATVTWQR
jgi:predicted DNA-binding WGR domain protein